MKGYRFYADFGPRHANMWNGMLEKRQSRRIDRKRLAQLADEGWRCHCVALAINVEPEIDGGVVLYEAAMANGRQTCNWDKLPEGYLQRNGKRISEQLARRLHPALFEILE